MSYYRSGEVDRYGNVFLTVFETTPNTKWAFMLIIYIDFDAPDLTNPPLGNTPLE